MKMNEDTNGSRENKQLPVHRRELLKGAAYTGAIAGGVSFNTHTVKASTQPDGGVFELTVPFISVKLKIRSPDDAVEIDGNPRFPPSIKTDSGIYIPESPSGLFKNRKPKAIAELPKGVQQVNPGTSINASPIAFGNTSEDGGNIVAGGSISANIQLTALGESATIQFGPDEVQVKRNESVTQSREVEFVYDTLEGKKTEQIDAKVSIQHYGERVIKSHEDLVAIPKDSDPGQHLGNVIRPEIEENGRVGNWTDVIDLSAIDAWGIEVRTHRGENA